MAKRLLVLLVILGVIFTGCPDDGGSGDSRFEKDYDIIVVGAGIAGMSAALTAADDTGLKVLLIEHQPYAGGLSGTSGGVFSAMQWGADTDSKTVWIDKYKHNMQGDTDDVNAKAYINATHDFRYPNYDKFYAIHQDSRITYNFLLGKGMLGNPNSIGGSSELIGGIATTGANRMESLWDIIEDDPNITNVLNAEAIGLLTENTTPKTVTGVKITFKGKTYNVKAQKVILATGGFSQSPELLAKYSATQYGGFDFSRGWKYHNAPDRGLTGLGHTMAMRDAGAGEYSLAYIEPSNLVFSPDLAPVSPALSNRGAAGTGSQASPMRRSAQILVDSNGIRYRPEDAFGGFVGSYTTYVHARDYSAPLPWYAIFSEAHLDDELQVLGNGITLRKAFADAAAATGANKTVVDAEIVKASTLAELSTKLFGTSGTKAADFVDMIKEYDAAVKTAFAGGDPATDWVDPLLLLSATEIEAIGAEVVGGKAAGDNGANLIRYGKDDGANIDYDITFYAIKVVPCIWDTMGGIPSDVYSRALTTELAWNQSAGTWATEGTASTIIKNLYVAGAISSRDFFNYGYHGGGSLTTYSTTGRIAALHAVEAILGD